MSEQQPERSKRVKIFLRETFTLDKDIPSDAVVAIRNSFCELQYLVGHLHQPIELVPLLEECVKARVAQGGSFATVKENPEDQALHLCISFDPLFGFTIFKSDGLFYIKRAGNLPEVVKAGEDFLSFLKEKGLIT
jgi:hypothetical protein